MVYGQIWGIDTSSTHKLSLSSERETETDRRRLSYSNYPGTEADRKLSWYFIRIWVLFTLGTCIKGKTGRGGPRISKSERKSLVKGVPFSLIVSKRYIS